MKLLLLDLPLTFFRFRAVGIRLGTVSPWGGGMWAFLHTLKTEGPLTVPQIARSRPVTRQNMQRMANEAANAGLIKFIENPSHKRSKLLTLTPKGKNHYKKLEIEIEKLTKRLVDGFTEQELEITSSVLKKLRDGFEDELD